MRGDCRCEGLFFNARLFAVGIDNSAPMFGGKVSESMCSIEVHVAAPNIRAHEAKTGLRSLSQNAADRTLLVMINCQTLK